MWAQQWGNIFDMVEPYPGKAGVDATPSMIEQVSREIVHRVWQVSVMTKDVPIGARDLGFYSKAGQIGHKYRNYRKYMSTWVLCTRFLVELLIIMQKREPTAVGPKPTKHRHVDRTSVANDLPPLQ